MKYNLCLIATSGDMSARGIGDKNSVYLFDSKHKKSVDAFLKAQLNWELHSLSKNFPNTKNRKPYRKYLDTFIKLKDLGIFTSKYDFRSHWDLEIFEDLKHQSIYKPYQIQKNGKELHNVSKIN